MGRRETNMAPRQDILDAIRDYVTTGFPHGHFVEAVGDCDWETALAHADQNNRENFTEIMVWRLQNLPRLPKKEPVELYHEHTKIVCPRCDGEGTVLNPEIGGATFTAEDFEDDPDLADNLKSGVYDVQCPACKGNKVITEGDYKEWSDAEAERMQDHYLSLRESGIYPGHRDYY